MAQLPMNKGVQPICKNPEKPIDFGGLSRIILSSDKRIIYRVFFFLVKLAGKVRLHL